MVAPWMVGMNLFERIGLKVWFLNVRYLFFVYFSGTPMSIMEWTKSERTFAVEALFQAVAQSTQRNVHSKDISILSPWSCSWPAVDCFMGKQL